MREKAQAGEERKKTGLAKIAGLELLIVGLLGLISLPCLAEWLKFKNMELYKTAYENSWHYIFEYPLSVLLIASVFMAGTGVFRVIGQNVLVKTADKSSI